MNEVITRDYRKKDNLKWLNDNFFIAVYDQNDNYITSFEDVESTGHAFNIKVMELLRKIRNNLGLEYNGHKLKLFVYRKEKIEEKSRGR